MSYPLRSRPGAKKTGEEKQELPPHVSEEMQRGRFRPMNRHVDRPADGAQLLQEARSRLRVAPRRGATADIPAGHSGGGGAANGRPLVQQDPRMDVDVELVESVCDVLPKTSATCTAAGKQLIEERHVAEAREEKDPKKRTGEHQGWSQASNSGGRAPNVDSETAEASGGPKKKTGDSAEGISIIPQVLRKGTGVQLQEPIRDVPARASASRAVATAKKVIEKMAAAGAREGNDPKDDTHNGEHEEGSQSSSSGGNRALVVTTEPNEAVEASAEPKKCDDPVEDIGITPKTSARMTKFDSAPEPSRHPMVTRSRVRGNVMKLLEEFERKEDNTPKTRPPVQRKKLPLKLFRPRSASPRTARSMSPTTAVSPSLRTAASPSELSVVASDREGSLTIDLDGVPMGSQANSQRYRPSSIHASPNTSPIQRRVLDGPEFSPIYGIIYTDATGEAQACDELNDNSSCESEPSGDLQDAERSKSVIMTENANYSNLTIGTSSAISLLNKSSQSIEMRTPDDELTPMRGLCEADTTELEHLYEIGKSIFADDFVAKTSFIEREKADLDEEQRSLPIGKDSVSVNSSLKDKSMAEHASERENGKYASGESDDDLDTDSDGDTDGLLRRYRSLMCRNGHNPQDFAATRIPGYHYLNEEQCADWMNFLSDNGRSASEEKSVENSSYISSVPRETSSTSRVNHEESSIAENDASTEQTFGCPWLSLSQYNNSPAPSGFKDRPEPIDHQYLDDSEFQSYCRRRMGRDEVDEFNGSRVDILIQNSSLGPAHKTGLDLLTGVQYQIYEPKTTSNDEDLIDFSSFVDDADDSQMDTRATVESTENVALKNKEYSDYGAPLCSDHEQPGSHDVHASLTLENQRQCNITAQCELNSGAVPVKTMASNIPTPSNMTLSPITTTEGVKRVVLDGPEFDDVPDEGEYGDEAQQSEQ